MSLFKHYKTDVLGTCIYACIRNAKWKIPIINVFAKILKHNCKQYY